MLFEIATPSGTTLGHETSQRAALLMACLVSVSQHAPVLVYCHHSGYCHIVARMLDGELLPLSN